MPREANLLVDVRTVPGQDHDRIRRDLRALASETERFTERHYSDYDKRLSLNRDRHLDVDVAFLTDRPCTLTDQSDPIVRAADWATRRITAGEPVYGGVPGATDGTFLWALKGIPIVTMGAGDREVPHQTDEWVDLEQLLATARIYALTALRYLQPGACR
jgi:succinyl-diaminopimelate desuccinylase